MAIYCSEDWKDGSEEELSSEEQKLLIGSVLTGFGVIGLMIAIALLFSLTVDAMDRGVFDGPLSLSTTT